MCTIFACIYKSSFLFLPFFGGVFYNILKKRKKVVSAGGNFVFFVYIEYILYIQAKITAECTRQSKKNKYLKNKKKSFFADSGGHAAHLPRVRSANLGRIGPSASRPPSARSKMGAGVGRIWKTKTAAGLYFRPTPQTLFYFFTKRIDISEKMCYKTKCF